MELTLSFIVPEDIKTILKAIDILRGEFKFREYNKFSNFFEANENIFKYIAVIVTNQDDRDFFAEYDINIWNSGYEKLDDLYYQAINNHNINSDYFIKALFNKIIYNKSAGLPNMKKALKYKKLNFFTALTNRIFVYPNSELDLLIYSLKGDRKIKQIFFDNENITELENKKLENGEKFDVMAYLLGADYKNVDLKATDFYPHFYSDGGYRRFQQFSLDLIKYTAQFENIHEYNNSIKNIVLNQIEQELYSQHEYLLKLFTNYTLYYNGYKQPLVFMCYLKETYEYFYVVVEFEGDKF